MVGLTAVGLILTASTGAVADSGSRSKSNPHAAPQHPRHPQHSSKPGKPRPPAAADDADQDGETEVSLADLVPTAAPTTRYELPFPCGETWYGSTRAGHSPSLRAVDFNHSDGDLGRPVVAAAGGTVVTAVVGKKLPSYGQHVVIDHGNGESSLYAHLDSVQVTVGQYVATGTPLGTLGATGNSEGAHLHFEQRVGGAVVDPWFHGAVLPANSTVTSNNCGKVAPADIPLVADVLGSRAPDAVVYRRTGRAGFRVARQGKPARVVPMGGPTSQPVIGDWDGDGQANLGVRTPQGQTFKLRVRGHNKTIRFGKRGDLPVAGNWDGAGPTEIGVRRPSTGTFLLRHTDGSITRVVLGDADDVPVTGDWNGDGITDLGVYDPKRGIFKLREINPFGDPFRTRIRLGRTGDVPVTGDWDRDGTTELGVWRPATATLLKRFAVAPSGPTDRLARIRYGRAS